MYGDYMKRSLLLAALFCSAGILNAQTPLVLTSSNVQMTQAGDTRSWHSVDVSGLSVPSTGENQTWDYSSMPVIGIGYSTTYNEADNPTFPDASFSYDTYYALAAYSLSGAAYYENKATGSYYSGNSYEEATFDLGGMGTLYIPEQAHAYGGGYARLQLPAQYGSTWSTDLNAPLNAELTIDALGISEAPVLYNQVNMYRDSVVGSGTLKLPGGATVEALLVRSVHTIIDSFYVAGEPASPMLLAALGLQQGTSFTSNQYSFYTTGMATAALSFYETDSQLTGGEISDELPTTSVTEEAVMQSVRLYPNPVTTGEVTLAFNKTTSGVWNVVVRNMMGQTIRTVAVEQTTGAVSLRVALDPSLAGGAYLYEIRNENGVRTGAGSFIVR